MTSTSSISIGYPSMYFILNSSITPFVTYVTYVTPFVTYVTYVTPIITYVTYVTPIVTYVTYVTPIVTYETPKVIIFTIYYLHYLPIHC